MSLYSKTKFLANENGTIPNVGYRQNSESKSRCTATEVAVKTANSTNDSGWEEKILNIADGAAPKCPS